jgi:hypothetical protein
MKGSETFVVPWRSPMQSVLFRFVSLIQYPQNLENGTLEFVFLPRCGYLFRSFFRDGSTANKTDSCGASVRLFLTSSRSKKFFESFASIFLLVESHFHTISPQINSNQFLSKTLYCFLTLLLKKNRFSSQWSF